MIHLALWIVIEAISGSAHSVAPNWRRLGFIVGWFLGLPYLLLWTLANSPFER